MDSVNSITAKALVPVQSGGGAALPAIWGGDGFSFADLIDIINPLQQLPGIGTLYRAITGDAISPAARLAGGALFGGPVGLAAAGVDTAVEFASGQDIGATVMGALDSLTSTTPETKTVAFATQATKLGSESDQWFSLFSMLAPDPLKALDVSSHKTATSAYTSAQKLTSA